MRCIARTRTVELDFRGQHRHPLLRKVSPLLQFGLRTAVATTQMGRAAESRAARLGELLQCRHDSQRVSRARQLHRGAVTPVAEAQA